LSSQGKYQLVFQRNGNLVLYQIQGSVIVWQAGQQNGNPGRAELQVRGQEAARDMLY
jgi:hypothetical protein